MVRVPPSVPSTLCACECGGLRHLRRDLADGGGELLGRRRDGLGALARRDHRLGGASAVLLRQGGAVGHRIGVAADLRHALLDRADRVARLVLHGLGHGAQGFDLGCLGRGTVALLRGAQRLVLGHAAAEHLHRAGEGADLVATGREGHRQRRVSPVESRATTPVRAPSGPLTRRAMNTEADSAHQQARQGQRQVEEKVRLCPVRPRIGDRGPRAGGGREDLQHLLEDLVRAGQPARQVDGQRSPRLGRGDEQYRNRS